MPETWGNWLSILHSCVCYAHQTRNIYYVLPNSVDVKAPIELWNPLSKKVIRKCSFALSEGPVNTRKKNTTKSNSYVGPVNIFLIVDIATVYTSLHFNWSEMCHYSDVIMGRWRLKSQASRLFTQTLVQAQIKENSKAPRHWPLWGEFTGDRNSPHKWAVTGKIFPFDVVIMSIGAEGIVYMSVFN